MATETLVSDPEVALRSASAARPVRALVLIGLVVAAHLPFLVLQAYGMLNRPQYHFVPFVLLGAFFLARRDTAHLGDLQVGDARVLVGGLLACCGLLAFAGFVFSPWVAQVSALLSVLPIAYGWGGRALFRAILPAWVFLWAMVPPLGYEINLVQELQALASRWSSSVLDVLGVLHFPHGNVIEVIDRQLFVEEACSGAHSLFVVMAAVLFHVLWSKRHIVHALALFAAAVAWVLLANVSRIIIVTIAYTRWGINLLEGWKHDVIGILVLLAVLTLLASTNEVLAYVTAFLQALWAAPRRLLEKWKHARARAHRVGGGSGRKRRPRSQPAGGDEVVPAAAGPSPSPSAPVSTPVSGSAPPTRWTDLGPFQPGLVAIMGLYALLGVGIATFAWPIMGSAILSLGPFKERLLTLEEADLAAGLGPFQRTEFKAFQRMHEVETFGDYSRIWTYRVPDANANLTVSVDFVFTSFHSLSTCYLGSGWTHVGAPQGEDRDGYIEEVDMVREGQHGLLLYRIVGPQGHCVDRPGAKGMVASLADRLSPWKPENWTRARDRFLPTYQVQFLVESERPLTEDEKTVIRAEFDRAHESIRSKIVPGFDKNS